MKAKWWSGKGELKISAPVQRGCVTIALQSPIANDNKILRRRKKEKNIVMVSWKTSASVQRGCVITALPSSIANGGEALIFVGYQVFNLR